MCVYTARLLPDSRGLSRQAWRGEAADRSQVRCQRAGQCEYCTLLTTHFSLELHSKTAYRYCTGLKSLGTVYRYGLARAGIPQETRSSFFPLVNCDALTTIIAWSWIDHSFVFAFVVYSGIGMIPLLLPCLFSLSFPSVAHSWFVCLFVIFWETNTSIIQNSQTMSWWFFLRC